MVSTVSRSDRYYPAVRTTLVVTYLAGLVGLHLPDLAIYFRPLSPLTLVSSLVILFVYHTDWRPVFYSYVVLTMLAGYLIEIIGVHTGFVFGHYAYGWGLGNKLWGVPPIIGINWLTLSYCCGSVCNRLPVPVWGKVAGASALMVALDVFMEPVAIRLDFWTWFGRPVPFQNYAGWWLVSLLLFSVWYALPFAKENRIAKWLLLLQFFFFIGQCLLMLL